MKKTGGANEKKLGVPMKNKTGSANAKRKSLYNFTNELYCN